MFPLQILVVDDEESMRLLLSSILKGEGYNLDTAANAGEALAKLEQKDYGLVLTDLKMPGMDGIELVSRVREKYPDTTIVVLTAYGTVETAVEAMKLGAWDFLAKPLASPDQLRLLVKKVVDRQQMVRENLLMKAHVQGVDPDPLVAGDPKMQAVLKMIDLVAPTDSTVLITGESGTGKELAARQVHLKSSRKEKPFVAVNCAAIPENLLESELFGYEKGAFTGASARKPGRFELAHGGTLFLDEIGEIPPGVQVKLLRVLQERNFERVGGTKQVAVDVRIIAATNRELPEAVKQHTFREDLYYRLNVFPLKLPPLRERSGDIIPLARHFIQKYAVRMKKKVEHLSLQAEEVLQNYKWPGNVRELSNLIERAIILCTGDTIMPDHLGIDQAENDEQEGGMLREMEKQTIVRALEECRGNRKLTAEKLGISLRTLYYKLREYGLE